MHNNRGIPDGFRDNQRTKKILKYIYGNFSVIKQKILHKFFSETFKTKKKRPNFQKI